MKPLKAIGYIRVSTADQAKQGFSLDLQGNKITLQADLADYDLVEIIRDEGHSAKNMKRPGIERVIQMVKAGEVEAVIIYKLDRLTRRVADLDRFIQLLNKKDIALISVKDSIDTKTAAGRMVLNVITAISQWEREAIGERTSDALRLKRSRGEKTGGSAPPFGYQVTGYRTDTRTVKGVSVKIKLPLLSKHPEEQKAIKLMDDLRGRGWSYRSIARELERRGTLTKTGLKIWNPKTVRTILIRAKQAA